MRMITVFLVLALSLSALCGCAGLTFTSKNDLSRAQVSLDEKERRIQELESLLSGRDAKIKEQDEQIRQLKDKLRSLGVFQ